MLPKVCDRAAREITHLSPWLRRLEIYCPVSLVLSNISQCEKCIITGKVLVCDAQSAQRTVRIDFRRCFVNLLGKCHLLFAESFDLRRHVILGERDVGDRPPSCRVLHHRLHKFALQLLDFCLSLLPIYIIISGCDCVDTVIGRVVLHDVRGVILLTASTPLTWHHASHVLFFVNLFLLFAGGCESWVSLIVAILELEQFVLGHIREKLLFHAEPVSFHDDFRAHRHAWFALLAPEVPLELIYMNLEQHRRIRANLHWIGRWSLCIEGREFAETLASVEGVEDEPLIALLDADREDGGHRGDPRRKQKSAFAPENEV